MVGLSSVRATKNEKAKIKEELLSIAWHPDRLMDWCMAEDEKRCRSNR